MAHDRLVAGIRCTQVLAQLSDYLDQELDAAARDQVDAHLRGCDWCERFGGHMAGVVTSLRRELQEPEPVDPDVAQRLRARLGLDGSDLG